MQKPVRFLDPILTDGGSKWRTAALAVRVEAPGSSSLDPDLEQFPEVVRSQPVRVDRAMTSWEEYHELLARLETEQAQREASGEAPSEDLVQSIKTHLTETPSNSLLGPLTEADARTDSPLCALPDDTLLRMLDYASNARLGAASTTARRLARLILAHKETLFRPSADGAGAVGATGLELARLETWVDNKQHEERPTFPEPPRRRMSLDGLLCHVKVTQKPKGRTRWVSSSYSASMRADVLSLPPLEPVVLVSRWLELSSRDGEENHLELAVPAFDFSLHSNITLDIALYNPRTKLVATLFRGDGEDEQEEMEEESTRRPKITRGMTFARACLCARDALWNTR